MSALTSLSLTKQTSISALRLLALRLAGVALVVMALPVSHLRFGETYPGDGQQGSGFLIIFWLIGMAAAAIYLITATIARALVAKKTLQFKIWMEIAVLLVFVGTLAYAGITAHYS